MIKKFAYIIGLAVFLMLFLSSTCFALSPSSDTIYEGIDVSDWQGNINYSEVKASGIDIVYIKASQGTNITDPYFKTNYNNAKMNDLKVGLYHFLTARTEEEAIEEAEYFSSVISGTSPDCKLAMDFENFGNLTKDEINSISTTFLEKVKSLTNKAVIIYSDAYNARNIFDSKLANSYPLWIAEYDVSSPSSNVNWNSWVGFQYSDTGTISGIKGFVDRDKFTDDILLGSNDVITTTPNNKNKIEYYTVRSGNTLSKIASEFGTTVNEIAGLNSIRNVNLIYPGEVLKIDVTRNLDEIQSNIYETNHIVYTIKRGDTLTAIANRFGISIESIVRLNNIKNPNLIYAGERLRINN